METAERNRLIKKILTRKFGQGNVRVKGSRGTGYGWVHVHIVTPHEDRQFYERRNEIMSLLNGIEIGTYGYDDPGSDYGYGKQILIDFQEPLGTFKNPRTYSPEAFDASFKPTRVYD